MSGAEVKHGSIILTRLRYPRFTAVCRFRHRLSHALLEIAFGRGVRGAAGQKRALRITGFLLIVLGVIDLVAPFTPMHLRGTEVTLTDTMHVILSVVTVLLILLIIGFGAVAEGKRFRQGCNFDSKV